MTRGSPEPPVQMPELLLKLLRAARIPPERLLDLLREQTSIRGRLTTTGGSRLAKRLPGLGPVNLTLRGGVVEGTVVLGPRDRLEFREMDALVHAGALPASVVTGMEGRRIDQLSDAPCLSGTRYPVLGVREYAEPPTIMLLFRSPRVPLPVRGRSRRDT